MAHTCDPSTLGGRGRRTDFEVSLGSIVKSLYQTNKSRQPFIEFFFFDKGFMLLLSWQILTLRLDKQLLRKTCHLFRNRGFWLTQRRQVTRGYKAWEERNKPRSQDDWQFNKPPNIHPLHPELPYLICGHLAQKKCNAVQTQGLIGNSW